MSKRLLYIEDMPDNYEIVRRKAAREKWECFNARDGASGLELAQRLQPDVILLDIRLPDVDGYEVARQLRQVLPAHVPILAVTGNSMMMDRERSLAACDEFVPKPIDVEALWERIGRQLERYRQE